MGSDGIDEEAMENEGPLIRLEGINKRFGGVQALDHVSIDVSQGEVHAIVGENGAGKTTLMNILAGIHRSDSGRIFLRGQEVRFRDPLEGRQHRIEVVFQELNLFPELSVVANIFVGRELRTAAGLLHEEEMKRRARESLNQIEVDIPVDQTVGKLTMGQRQLVEIARALTHNAEIIIMDEPNSALTAKETDALFTTIGQLRSRGLTVLYISHRLEEVFRIADRISVLHDGRYVATWRSNETSIPEVVRAMMGGVSIKQATDRAPGAAGEVLLSVRGLTGGSTLNDLNLEARGGEVIGLAGLEGSGIVDFFHVVFGLERKLAGRVFVRGKEEDIRSANDAIALGIALIPANRREEGLMMDWSLRDNVSLVVLDRMIRAGLIDQRRVDETASRFVGLMRIATDSIEKNVIDLSGGNQQKVAIAKWLATQADVLMLNDPARGIDVGAKAEIFAFARELAAQGKTILMTSSDVTEIVDVCDRIMVFYKGKVCAEFARSQATKQSVMGAMMQGPIAERVL